jgi:hypothetical protein
MPNRRRPPSEPAPTFGELPAQIDVRSGDFDASQGFDGAAFARH